MESLRIIIENPLECIILRRLNRFVVEIQIEDQFKRACINNTGRLQDFLVPGNTGFCTLNSHQLKTSHRLFAVNDGKMGAIIDTQLQMRAFENALETGGIPWLEGYSMRKRNPRLGNSILDYLLASGEKRVHLEVKSAVLREGNYAMYPDCPTDRGRRHIRELIAHRDSGRESVIVFIAALPGIKAFKPSRSGDPDLCNLLVKARRIGVDIRAIAIAYDPSNASIYMYHENLPVRL